MCRTDGTIVMKALLVEHPFKIGSIIGKFLVLKLC